MTKINFFIFLRRGPSVDLSGLGGPSHGLVSLLFVLLSQLILPVRKGSSFWSGSSLTFNRYQVPKCCISSAYLFCHHHCHLYHLNLNIYRIVINEYYLVVYISSIRQDNCSHPSENCNLRWE